jgi:D-alanyl-D-alanine carboxypeptidase
MKEEPRIQYSTRRRLLGTAVSYGLCASLSSCLPGRWSAPLSLKAYASEGPSSIDQQMQRYMTHYPVPGASLAFFRGNRLLYTAAYGVADQGGTPVAPNSLFRIASNSKAFTSAAIFTLIEAGRLSLTSSIFGSSGVLSEYQTSEKHRDWQESVTVHNLLTHTAGGWSNDGPDPMFQVPELNHEQLISWTLRSQPLLFAPGTHYAYSNFGYCVLGRVIEKVSGKAYPLYTSEHVLSRAKLVDMQIATERPASNEVHYYSVPGDGNDYDFPITRMDSHGGWIATAADQARFLSALFSPIDSGVASGVVSAGSLRLMTTGTPANENYGCGLSLTRDGNGWNCWHRGSLPGTTSLMVHTHSGMSWAVVLNTRNMASDMDTQLDKLMWTMATSVPDWRAR